MCLAFLLLLLAAMPAWAQGTGTISGVVFEADSVTAVIGANVRVEGTRLGAATDMDGNFRIIGVPVGTYTLAASYAGASTVLAHKVRVVEGETVTVPFTLETDQLADWVCMGGDDFPLIARGPFSALVILGDEFEEVSNEPCVFPWPRLFWRDS